jgi:hypothetical protein
MSLPYWYRAALQQEREDDLRRQAAHQALVHIAQTAAAKDGDRRHLGWLPWLGRLRHLGRGA